MESARIERYASARVRVADDPWLLCQTHREQIARYWRAESVRKPTLFNGPVHVLRRLTRTGDQFHAEALLTDFATFLYWRDHGYPDRSVYGSGVAAVLRAGDGALLLGEAAAGTSNAGRVYMFSGVLDGEDRLADGTLDVIGLAIRELREEAGLAPDMLVREPGVQVICDGVWVTFVIGFRAALDAESLREQVLAHIHRAGVPELADVHIVRRSADLEGKPSFGHTRAIVRDLFGG